MSHDGFVFLVFGLAVAGVIGFVHWLREPARRARAALAAVRAQPIGKVTGGAPAKIIGTARPAGEPLVAPLSGRECVAWHVKVESHGTRNQVRTIIEDRDFCDFVLEDESGRALVKPLTSRFAVESDETYTLGEDAAPELTAFLEKHGEKATFLGVSRGLVFHEGVVAVDEEVAVLGMGRWETDPEPSADRDYRERPRRLVMEDEAELPLTLSDDFRAFR